MSAGDLEATFYVVVGRADYYRNAMHVRGRAMRLTQAPPRNVRGDEQVLRLTVQIPAEALEAPEVVVTVPVKRHRAKVARS